MNIGYLIFYEKYLRIVSYAEFDVQLYVILYGFKIYLKFLFEKDETIYLLNGWR
jgi:hypothetical protein